MTNDQFKLLKCYLSEIIKMRIRAEEIAEDVAIFDEKLAENIFTSIAAEMTNKEMDLQTFLDKTTIHNNEE